MITETTNMKRDIAALQAGEVISHEFYARQVKHQKLRADLEEVIRREREEAGDTEHDDTETLCADEDQGAEHYFQMIQETDAKTVKTVMEQMDSSIRIDFASCAGNKTIFRVLRTKTSEDMKTLMYWLADKVGLHQLSNKGNICFT